MLTPVLVLGRADTAALLRPGLGYDDDGALYDLVARTEDFMPGGLGGEAAFFTIYLTTTHYEVGTVFRITPYLDGVPLAATTLLFATVSDGGEERVTEIDLSVPYLVGGVEALRYAPRGQRFAVAVETRRAAGSGVNERQIVDGIEIEFEVVQEGKTPAVGV